MPYVTEGKVVEFSCGGEIIREITIPGLTKSCIWYAERLPNGNTLVCNGDFHIKELPRGEVMMLDVKPGKEIVWKLTRSDVGKTLPHEMRSVNPVYHTSQVSLIRKEIEP